MKKIFEGFFYSLPVQLFFLHFRRYQVLLLFWLILFATISGHFLKPYGADSLMLDPEYLGNVSALSFSFVGFMVGSYIMSWNITTFILHTKHIRFLATTSQPFLKYCINNAIIPLIFLITYFALTIDYQEHQELASGLQILQVISGFFGGFILSLALAFGYFFGTDKNIYRKMSTHITSANEKYERATRIIKRQVIEKQEMRVDWFFSATFGLRKPRNIRHYSQEFLSSIFKRHHIAAIQAVFMALVLLIVIGFISDNPHFQVPAGASIMLFFTILTAVAGALSLFLGNWSVPVVLIIYTIINVLYIQRIIDPRNKAYGLNYNNNVKRPDYSKEGLLSLLNDSAAEKDKAQFISTLNKWKAKQHEEKPVIFFLNVSGGGNRSADFVMNVLTQLDTVTNGKFFQHTFLITGASGGMLGASYYRELELQKAKGNISSLQQKKYLNNISKDLLNPVFTSLVTRDMIGPLRKFQLNNNSYILDRGYAFEQKLNDNTQGILNKKLIDYKLPETNAVIPTILFTPTITRDGRKLYVSTQPVRFMMQPVKDSNNLNGYDVDGVDYQSLFKNQDPYSLRFLTAMRMSATFPFVMPNIELPTDPLIDVMDAGVRDNYGDESSLRFINIFKDWLKENTSKVVLVDIRDRAFDNWARPYEISSIIGLITKPILLLQSNLFNLQNFNQENQLNYMLNNYGNDLQVTGFSYSAPQNSTASLSFHLTASEKKEISETLNDSINKKSFKNIIDFLKK